MAGAKMDKVKFDRIRNDLTLTQKTDFQHFLESKSDDEIAEIRKVDRSSASRNIANIAKSFGIHAPKGTKKVHCFRLLDLCLIHIPEEVTRPHIYDEFSDRIDKINADDRSSTSTNNENIAPNALSIDLKLLGRDRLSSPIKSEDIDCSITTNKTISLGLIGQDSDFSESNVVQNVRNKIKNWIEMQCEDIRFSDGQHRNVENFHVNVYCRSSGQRMLLVERIDSHYVQNRKIKPIALLGKAGSGKTNTLKFLAMLCITGQKFPNFVPFYFKLRNEDWHDNKESTIFDLIVENLKFIKISQEEIEQILNKGILLLLLDGLDEVPTIYRQKVEKNIDDFILQKHSGNKAVITCRSASAKRNDSRYLYIDILDLDDTEIRSFIKQYYQECKNEIDFPIDRNYEKLLARINEQNKFNIKELAKTPINLTLICKSFFKDGKIADKRYQMYEYAFNILVREWNEKKNIVSEVGNKVGYTENIFNSFLCYLARKSFKEQKDFSENDLRRYQIQYLNNNNLSADIQNDLHKQVVDRSGLLAKQNNEYCFRHLTWHEYLVAKDIVNHIENGTENFENLFINLPDRQWREIFLFAVEMLFDPSIFLQKMQDAIANIVINHDYLQDILINLLKKSQNLYKKTKYSESVIRAIYFEGVIDNYNEIVYTCSVPISIGEELLLDRQLEMMLAVTIRKDDEIEKNIGNGLYTNLDRLIEPLLEQDLPVQFDYSPLNNDRFEIRKSAVKLLRERHYIVKAIELAARLNHHSLRTSLEELERNIPESFGTDNDCWNESNTCQLWAENLRQVMIEHRQIGHDWQNPQNGMTIEARQVLKDYYNANTILAECLNLTDLLNASQVMKEKRRSNLLLPISEIERRKNYK
ncbi:MAG: NACHT domain-containing protein [Pseudanabaena sp. CAN_BIN31]|nr:NACHT domain-containing protein [Pseudanabaena sp. CAN_BIN31]